MAKNMDRRVRKTRSQLRHGLAELLKEKSIKEITVKELVEKVDINRSTFYLHYTDIYDMMEKIENELIGEIEELVHTYPVSPFNEDSFPFIEDIFSILAENRDICTALLGPNGDISFLHRIEYLLAEHSLNALKETFPEKMDDLKYYYAFCLSGCIGLVKTWLSKGSSVSPQHMAELTFKLIMNALQGFYPDLELLT
ncbi:MAG: TetR/AcrR family transcriptional regulator C-terminal domain-containing protein [Candidatus Ruminococcus intestinipullorum]|nr:TetR/AcrR family transcriptional regulator C-terminal domain-containing protein [Candidatus Ruminococcus intestinipullorum]